MNSTKFDFGFCAVTLSALVAFALMILFVLSAFAGLYNRALTADATRADRATQLEIDERRFFEIADQPSHSAADEAFMLMHLRAAGVEGY